MLSVAEALELVLTNTGRRPATRVRVAEAIGLVLAEDVASDVDSPPHDKAMVDGYAVQAVDLAAGCADLLMLEEVTAGAVPTRTVARGSCTRIMTGAPLPAGADAVVMIERSELLDGQHAFESATVSSLGRTLCRAATRCAREKSFCRPAKRFAPPRSACWPKSAAANWRSIRPPPWQFFRPATSWSMRNSGRRRDKFATATARCLPRPLAARARRPSSWESHATTQQSCAEDRTRDVGGCARALGRRIGGRARPRAQRACRPRRRAGVSQGQPETGQAVVVRDQSSKVQGPRSKVFSLRPWTLDFGPWTYLGFRRSRQPGQQPCLLRVVCTPGDRQADRS